MYYDPRRRPAAPSTQAAVVPLHVAEQIEAERRRLAVELEASRREVQALRAAQETLAAQVRADAEERRALRQRFGASEQGTELVRQRVATLEQTVSALRAELAGRGPAVVEGGPIDGTATQRLGDVHDSVSRALAASPDPRSPWHEGYTRIGAQVEGVLKAAGVELVGEAGERFDPTQHEAIGTVPAGAVADGQIAQVVRSGLRSADGLLRPAQVVVALG
jgi:hypothetical protein